MNKSAKVAISMPAPLLNAVEKERKSKGESRSEFFQRAAVNLLKQEREAQAVDAYVSGYRVKPETFEEIEVAHRAGTSVLSEEPW